MDEMLHVPAFARIDDYMGVWSVEPARFRSIWDVASRMNLAVHIKDGAEPIRSALEKVPSASGKSIAVVRLNGLLMKSQSSFGGTSTVQARRDIRQASSDPDVSGILLLIDSPGGTVAGTSDLAADVKAAGKSKPVFAHIDDLGASAAYWIASQADKITANAATAMIGSIGTVQVVYDYSSAAEKAGIKTLAFSTGPLKGAGIQGTKVTDEQAAYYQTLVNDLQKSFDAGVMKGRGMTAKELQAVRTGGVFVASSADASKSAIDLKLIDGIQPLSKTLAELNQATKQTGARMGAISLPRAKRRLPMLANRGT